MASYPLLVCQQLIGARFRQVVGSPGVLSGQLLPFAVSTATIVASLAIIGIRFATMILVVALQPELVPKLELLFQHYLIGHPAYVSRTFSFVMPKPLGDHTLQFAVKMEEMVVIVVAVGKTSMVPYTVIGC